MTVKKILCPIDFSAGSAEALRVAIRMARENDAELVLAHAWYVPASAYSLEIAFPPEIIDGFVADAERGLAAAVKGAIADGVKHTTSKLLNGLPWVQIVDELAHGAYDFCVIGTHGRTGLKRVLLGSVAETVVRHAPCSVLAVRPDGEAKPFKHALVPTDFSESAGHALDAVAGLLAPDGSITLLHAIEMPIGYTPEDALLGYARDIERHAAASLEREVARLRSKTSLKVEARSVTGGAGGQILALLDEDRSIDLVVMGSHGRTGIKRALLGSVAEKIVRHARCPVFVARKRA